MTSPRTCFATGVTLLSLAACSSPSGGGPTSSGSSATSGSSSTTVGAGGSGGAVGSGGSKGTGGFAPPPVAAACAAPAVTPGADVMAAMGQRFWGLQLVWGGAEAALAYAESTAAGDWPVTLQLLTPAGAAQGAAILLGTSTEMPTVALGTDGSRYLACWDHAGAKSDQIMCAAVPVGGGAVKPGASFSGSLPSLAAGPGGWALAFVDASGTRLGALGDDAKLTGATPATLAAVAMPAPLVLATPSGYAVVLDSNHVYRFGPDLKITGSVSATGLSAGMAASAAAASGESVGVGLVAQGNNSLVVIDAANKVSASFAADDGMAMTYSHLAVAGGKGSFAVVWSDFGGDIGYRAMDGADKPVGAVVSLVDVAWDDNPVAITAVGDGFLVATAAGEGLDDLKVAHLACP